jgi:hypothetical protein
VFAKRFKGKNKHCIAGKMDFSAGMAGIKGIT